MALNELVFFCRYSWAHSVLHRESAHRNTAVHVVFGRGGKFSLITVYNRSVMRLGSYFADLQYSNYGIIILIKDNLLVICL